MPEEVIQTYIVTIRCETLKIADDMYKERLQELIDNHLPSYGMHATVKNCKKTQRDITMDKIMEERKWMKHQLAEK